MPATRYGASPWIEEFPRKQRPVFGGFAGVLEAPLVIIGGGLAGVMTAYACATAGVRALLLEADRIGAGGSGRTSGVFAGASDLAFVDLVAASGRKVARAHFEQSRRAVLDLVSTVRRLGLGADLATLDAFRVAPVGGSPTSLQHDLRVRRDAGLDGLWHTPSAVLKATGLESAGGLRLRPWGQCDPYRLALGFADAALTRGVEIFERSPVTSVAFDRMAATVVTPRGRITAGCVVHCTGEPTALVRGLKRHFSFQARSMALSAVLPGPVRKAVGPRDTVVCDTDSPPHLIRWTEDDRVLIAGADHARPAARALERVHVQRTGQLMYELSRLYPAISGVLPAFGWSVPMAYAADGGVVVGPHRNFPHQLFAFGTAHDPARAFLASRILARHVLGTATGEDEPFGFSRTH